MLNQLGFTLLEVLITMVILAVGLLGLANLQTKMQSSQVESYQRAQAVLLLQDMVNRIDANRTGALTGAYAFAGTRGTGSTDPDPCTQANMAARDLCEWSNRIKGSSETTAGTNTGAMIGGRGCVTQVQAPNPAPGVCTPGIYRVSVAWQGLTATVAPALDCAEDLYGADDALRRVVSVTTLVSLPRCQ